MEVTVGVGSEERPRRTMGDTCLGGQGEKFSKGRRVQLKGKKYGRKRKKLLLGGEYRWESGSVFRGEDGFTGCRRT